MARQPPGPPPPPVAQRLRLHYAKRGRLRFTSHRDFQRALERAVRRAHLPIAHSAGFSPHPKISYAGAAPTGVASEAEYVELGLTVEMDPHQAAAALHAALPAGLDVVEVVVAGSGALAERLQASRWRIRLDGVDPQTAGAAVKRFLDADSIPVERLTKSGMRTFDARGPVVGIQVDSTDESCIDGRVGAADRPICAILNTVVRHVTPAVRPDDVLTGLRHVADLVPPTPPAVTRLAQGPLDVGSGAVSDPLAPDRR